MTKLLCFGCSFLLAATHVSATALFSEDFSYSDGDLAGRGPWLQTGTITASPIQVLNNKAMLGTSGQDVNGGLSSPFSLIDGSTFYIGATINVSAAQATGDYFLHWSPAASTTIFISRIEARSSGAGFQLGYVETSGTGASLTWGTTELNFNQDYRIVLAYNVLPGTASDTAALYVDPTDLAVEGNNMPYLTDSWTSATAESTTLGALNLRQGTGANAATLSVDDLGLATTFAEAAVFTPVPEPATLSLLAGFGLLAWTFARRRN